MKTQRLKAGLYGASTVACLTFGGCTQSDGPASEASGSSGGTSEITAASGTETGTGSSTTTAGSSSTTAAGGDSSSSNSSSTTDDSATGDTDTDTDSDTDTDGGELALCELEDFEAENVVSISDPFCGGGARCTALATCTVGVTTPPRDGRDRWWRYTLLCDGEWGGDELAAGMYEGLEVRVWSTRELNFGNEALGYEMETDFADRFGGVDYVFKELLIADARVAVDVSTELGFNIAGMSATTLKDEACNGSTFPQINADCAWRRGLVGRGANGDEISVINEERLVGSWLISSEGLEQCGEGVTGAYTRDLEVSAVHTDLLAP